MKTILIALAFFGVSLAHAQTWMNDPNGGGPVPPSNAAGLCYLSTGANQPAAWGTCPAAGAALTYTQTPQAFVGVVTAPNILPNVLTYACGVTINDGALHPVSTAPAGSCFAGKTTLASIAAISINGTNPFYFLTDSGTITGPLCTYGTTTNCFRNGYYALTDAMVTNGTLDIGWLAAQAAELTRNATYPMGTIRTNFSIMHPIGVEVFGTSAHSEGQGETTSILAPNRDFGAGIAEYTCGDPAGTPLNQLGWALAGNGQCTGTTKNLGIINSFLSQPSIVPGAGVAMDGMRWGGHWNLEHVKIQGFRRGLVQTGDHANTLSLLLINNYIGHYLDSPNGHSCGTNCWSIVNLGNIGNSDYRNQSFFIGIDVGPGATLSQSFNGQSYLAGPIPIAGEASGHALGNGPNGSDGCTAIIGGASFESFQAEYTDIGVVQDMSAYPGTISNSLTTYDDTKKCRDINNLVINNLFIKFEAAKDASIAANYPNLRRRDAFGVNEISDLQINNMASESAGKATPNAGGSLDSVRGWINANFIQTTNSIGIVIQGDVDSLIANAGTTPLVAAPVSNTEGKFVQLINSGKWSGWMRPVVGVGSYTVTALHDCIESTNGTAQPCGTSLTLGSFMGVAMQAGVPVTTNGNTTNYVPIATKGTVGIASGYNTFTGGTFKTSTGVGQLNVVGAVGGTDGTYTLAFGAGCVTPPSGTITIATGVTTGTLTSEGGNCSSAPAVTVTGTPAFTTAPTLSVNWPSARMQPIGNTAGGGTIIGGYYGGLNGGTAPLGTIYESVDLETKAVPAVSSGASLSGAAFTGPVSATSFSSPVYTSTDTTHNGSLNLPFNGVAAATPGTASFQMSPAINITTPWSLSPAAAPATGFMFGTNTSGVVQQSFRTISGLLATLTAASGNATVTGNAASQVLATYTVPANTIPALGCLRVEFDAFLSTGTAVAKTFSIAFGSASLSWNADSTGTSGQTYNGTVKICNNNGATGSQVIIARPLLRGATLISGNASFSAAIDTTAAQTLALSWTAPATEIVQVRLMTVELTR